MKIRQKIALLISIPILWFGAWGLTAYRQQEGLICSILALSVATLLILYFSVGLIKALNCKELTDENGK